MIDENDYCEKKKSGLDEIQQTKEVGTLMSMRWNARLV